MKTAEIIFETKKEPHFSESYQPISLLSTMNNVLAILLLNRINDHLEDNQLMDNDQFRFRPIYSTSPPPLTGKKAFAKFCYEDLL